MRTPIAERVLAAARAILVRHEDGKPVHHFALSWAQFIVETNA